MPRHPEFETDTKTPQLSFFVAPEDPNNDQVISFATPPVDAFLAEADIRYRANYFNFNNQGRERPPLFEHPESQEFTFSPQSLGLLDPDDIVAALNQTLTHEDRNGALQKAYPNLHVLAYQLENGMELEAGIKQPQWAANVTNLSEDLPVWWNRIGLPDLLGIDPYQPYLPDEVDHQRQLLGTNIHLASQHSDTVMNLLLQNRDSDTTNPHAKNQAVMQEAAYLSANRIATHNYNLNPDLFIEMWRDYVHTALRSEVAHTHQIQSELTEQIDPLLELFIIDKYFEWQDIIKYFRDTNDQTFNPPKIRREVQTHRYSNQKYDGQHKRMIATSDAISLQTLVKGKTNPQYSHKITVTDDKTSLYPLPLFSKDPFRRTSFALGSMAHVDNAYLLMQQLREDKKRDRHNTLAPIRESLQPGLQAFNSNVVIRPAFAQVRPKYNNQGRPPKRYQMQMIYRVPLPEVGIIQQIKINFPPESWDWYHKMQYLNYAVWRTVTQGDAATQALKQNMKQHAY